MTHLRLYDLRWLLVMFLLTFLRANDVSNQIIGDESNVINDAQLKPTLLPMLITTLIDRIWLHRLPVWFLSALFVTSSSSSLVRSRRTHNYKQQNQIRDRKLLFSYGSASIHIVNGIIY